MKKLLTILLMAFSLCVPLLVSAQEVQPTEDTEGIIPIYFFVNEDGNTFGITPISEDQFLWFYFFTHTTQASTSQQANSQPFSIGGEANHYFDGLIDEARFWTDIRTAQEIADNYQTELIGTEANLLSYWKLNDNILDETSTNNDLTNNNSAVFNSSVPFTTTSMGYQMAASMPTSNGEQLTITDGNQTGLDITGDLSIELWYKPTSQPGTNRSNILVRKTDAYEMWYENYAGTKELTMHILGSSEKTWRYAYTLTNDTWYHLAWTYASSTATASLYINGSYVSNNNTFPSSINNSAGNFSIGDDSVGYGLSGQIDEVRVWNDVRTGTEISNNYNIELAGTETNLQGYWKFSEDFIDETNNSNDLTTSTVSEASGTNSKSLDIEKDSSQYLSITDTNQTGLDLTGDFTIEFWVKVESFVNDVGSNNNYITKMTGDSYAMSFLSTSGVVTGRVFLYNPTEYYCDSANLSVSAGTWFHYAVTYDASAHTIEFFVNGASKGTCDITTTSISNSNGTFRIGGFNHTADGLIDEIRVWNDVRTSQEISANYQQELVGNEANMVGYWKLNDTSYDETSNNNDLTNNNSALFSTNVPFVGVTTSTSPTSTVYYLYEGNTGSNYANPHALTSVSSTDSNISYVYDNNGNLTSYGDWANVWDYMNRLIQSVNSTEGTTTTYQYDQSGQRVKKTENGVVSVYPNKYYTIENGTIKKHIFAGDTELASVEGMTTTFHHVDHLSGSSVETDEEGYVTEVLDYYPFGSTRLDEKYTTYENDKKFTGHMYDDATGLYYMGARYQDSARGQFISQDPVFLAIGDNKKLTSLLGNDLDSENNQRKNFYSSGKEKEQKQKEQVAKFLSDPQQLNAYAYARNNPLVYNDPTGKYLEVSVGGTAMGLSGSTGFRFDSSGFNFFAAGGVGAGFGGSPFSLSYTPGVEVSHTTETTMFVGGSAAYGFGLGISKTGEDQSATYSIKNSSTEYSVVIGLGADVYARKDISIPIFGRQSSVSTDSVLNKPTYLNAAKPQSTNTTSKSNNSSILNKIFGR